MAYILFLSTFTHLAFLIGDPSEPKWLPNMTFDQENGTLFKLLLSSDVVHESYVRIVKYTFLMRASSDTIHSMVEMDFQTLNNSGDPYYLDANTSASLILPVSFRDHLKLFSVLVIYEANGLLFNVTSEEVDFNFYDTFQGIKSLT